MGRDSSKVVLGNEGVIFPILVRELKQGYLSVFCLILQGVKTLEFQQIFVKMHVSFSIIHHMALHNHFTVSSSLAEISIQFFPVQTPAAYSEAGSQLSLFRLFYTL